MLTTRLTFSNTSPKRKRVNFLLLHTVTRFALVLSFLSLLFFTGCQEQKLPPLPNKKSAATKQREREAAKKYLSDKERTTARRNAIVQAVKWLGPQQSDDGGWHSQTYGNLKGGAATTALVFYTLSHLSDDVWRELPPDTVSPRTDFLAQGLEKKGFVVCPDGTMDEPTYATALYLMAISRLRLGVPIATREQMQDFLLSEQCTEARGFAKDDPNYGGWDLAGGAGLQGETPGTNISITRFVTQALIHPYSGFSQDRKEMVLAWAARVQNLPGDGGFYFHPATDHEGNKAQWADGDERKKARSYGTCTCDGILLLAALGVPADDPRMQAAIRWTVNNFTPDRVPGFEDAPPELDWQNGLYYYYLMSLAQSLPHFSAKDQLNMRDQIQQALLDRQEAAGYWQNQSARMREDDPLIATCFAILALSALEEAEHQAAGD